MSSQDDLAKAAQTAWDARCMERRKAWEGNGIGMSEAFRRAAIETRDELGPRPGGDIVGTLFVAAAQIAFLATVLPMLAPILGPAKQIKAWADRLRAGLDVAGVNVPDPGTLVAQGASRFLMGVFLKRWGPLVGSAILVATIILQAFGQTQIAQALTSIGGFLPSTDGGITAGEITAAIAVGTGLFLKIKALIKAAQTP
jgi:hypothetical protein